jgi:cob(I)alamin adenosyltransferase
MSDERGIRVLTGEGKGKTTTALGLACLAARAGLKVFVVQFLKTPDSSGEHFAAASLAPALTIKAMGRKGFIYKRGCEPLDRIMAEMALEEVRGAMLSGEYQVVVADEINVAVYMGLIDVEDALEIMDNKPLDVELIMTGRYAHPRIIERADGVTEMVNIKHYFDRGAGASKGIEY